MSRFPPPPRPPPNPWATRSFQETPPIMEYTSGWPHRLLHVETMTSHVKRGECTYNGVEAPTYNIMSYTWGFYQDRTGQQPSLTIHGVDWPIPKIQATHFTPETFHDAIRTVADGVKHSCQWIWLDVACIPQAHDDETSHSKELRVQEIGRQGKIFRKATEGFVWISSLRYTDLLQHQKSLVSILDIIDMVNIGPRGHMYPDPTSYLQTLQELVLNYCSSWNRLLDHPWFISLWTLQESKLRTDATIIFDDGHMWYQLDDGRRTVWTLKDISHMLETLVHLIFREDDGTTRARSITRQVRLAESMEAELALNKPHDISDELLGHLERLSQRLGTRGFTVLSADFPNVVYSLAQHRRSTQPEDRIYGIIQTYDISCGQLPDRPKELSRLQALEDDFGTKLIKRLPIVSQFFVHTMEDSRPRRSWLITNESYAADLFWSSFISKKQIENLFTAFEVVQRSLPQSPAHDLFLRFEGKAWNLDCMIGVLKDPPQRGPLRGPKMTFLEASFERSSNQGTYTGLILDHHVSKALLGHSFAYFLNLETVLDACQKLSDFYCSTAIKGNSTTVARHIQVALLGSSWNGNLPAVDYVGLVLAPIVKESFGMQNLQNSGERTTDSFLWERVGLLRWTEHYRDNPPVLHEFFPPSHDFKCLIR